jgi:hypothetical protein
MKSFVINEFARIGSCAPVREHFSTKRCVFLINGLLAQVSGKCAEKAVNTGRNALCRRQRSFISAYQLFIGTRQPFIEKSSRHADDLAQFQNRGSRWNSSG